MLPNRVLAVIGEHEGFDIERVRITHDRRFVASASHDQSIRFWSLARYTEPGYGKQEETETSLTVRLLFFSLPHLSPDSCADNKPYDD